VDRIRRVLHYEGIQWWGDELRATTTLGYATVIAGDTAESLMERAEISLAQNLAKAATAGRGKDSNT